MDSLLLWNKCTKLSGLFFLFWLVAVQVSGQDQAVQLKTSPVICGADQTELYVSKLKNLKVGLVGNKTSRVGSDHLLDVLVREGIHVLSVFCPEHGFRGTAEAGELVDDQVDLSTGIPIKSLYGSHKKPTAADLEGIDILVFDIQDVGARFYTYISTLHYVMESAAENSIPVLILDRPNPNGFYVDGPIRKKGFDSFVGMHPVPVVHGMTIGEYGRMINGESWLAQGLHCQLEVVACKNYDHETAYLLPVPPSPNLPNQESVYLYPSLCFFEGTVVSIGRGTDFPFQVYGHPQYPGNFSFTPNSRPGASLHPKWENQLCLGVDLREVGVESVFRAPGLQLEWLIDAYKNLGHPADFFTSYFDTLAGSPGLREMIQAGKSVEEIRESWKEDLIEFQKIRNKYLIYR